MNARIMAGLCAIYLAGLLVFNLVVGIPISWWLIVAVLTPVVAALYLRLRDWYFKPLTGVEWLTEHIQMERWAWQQLEKEWLGRPVRLQEDIRNSNEPEGLQVYVRAGTVGKIVALNRDEHAPFSILFPGFGHKVVVRLEKLDLHPPANLAEEYDAA